MSVTKIPCKDFDYLLDVHKYIDELKLLPGIVEQDPCKTITWNRRLKFGTIQSRKTIRFRVNKLGLLIINEKMIYKKHCLFCHTVKRVYFDRLCSEYCSDKYYGHMPKNRLNDETSDNIEHEEEERFDWLIETNDIIKKMFGQDWNWDKYLYSSNKRAASVRLFKNPYPLHRNFFEIGQRLEAIDPRNQSAICVMTVIDIFGYRIKLHFDSYPSKYDFWINCDSRNIFPCGYVQQYNINIASPMNYNENFNWLKYLKDNNVDQAPSYCFNLYKVTVNDDVYDLVEIGMKFEAINKLYDGNLYCASVAAKLENRFLVQFDGYHKKYCYWTTLESPYIFPVGWSKENNYNLIVPPSYTVKSFNWSDYLTETNSYVLPRKIIYGRLSNQFVIDTKLEAVDPRSPHLVRVATIKEIECYQLKIVFDGLPDDYSAIYDDDSEDIHPIQWSKIVNHELRHPLYKNEKSNCPTLYCSGEGNFSNKDIRHNNIIDCPYNKTIITMKNAMLNNRLKLGRIIKNKKNTKNTIIVNEERINQYISEYSPMLLHLWNSSTVANYLKKMKLIEEKTQVFKLNINGLALLVSPINYLCKLLKLNYERQEKFKENISKLRLEFENILKSTEFNYQY